MTQHRDKLYSPAQIIDAIDSEQQSATSPSVATGTGVVISNEELAQRMVEVMEQWRSALSEDVRPSMAIHMNVIFEAGEPRSWRIGTLESLQRCLDILLSSEEPCWVYMYLGAPLGIDSRGRYLMTPFGSAPVFETEQDRVGPPLMRFGPAEPELAKRQRAEKQARQITLENPTEAELEPLDPLADVGPPEPAADSDNDPVVE